LCLKIQNQDSVSSSEAVCVEGLLEIVASARMTKGVANVKWGFLSLYFRLKISHHGYTKFWESMNDIHDTGWLFDCTSEKQVLSMSVPCSAAPRGIQESVYPPNSYSALQPLCTTFLRSIFRDVVADGISNCARVAQSASKWVRLQRSVVVGSMTCRLLHCGGLKESSGELEAKATRKTGVKI